MRVLLVSTYELGHQPVHLAVPAAALGASGMEVVSIDLAVSPWDPALLDRVDAVAISVPMHTAMRLADSLADTIRDTHSQLPIAFYGLYAAVGVDDGADSISRFAGEYLADLIDWAGRLARGEAVGAGVERSRKGSPLLTPDRSRLPSHDRYARLEWMGEARLAAAVEASHGCRHRCRHCPIPVLYDGRMTVVGQDVVLADIGQLVEGGVRHVTFADPDFLNAPRYSLDLLRAAHEAHPELTFDATVKVEHILRHESIWPEAASLGLLFVISAFESVDPGTLDILDKGHSVQDMSRALDVLRFAGVHVRPTWLPFLPWTVTSHVVDLARFLDQEGLWSATDPVQLAIKLLIPQGSLLERHPAVIPHLTGYQPSSLTWSWLFSDEETGRLQLALEAIAAEGSDCGAEAAVTLAAMRDLIYDAGGAAAPPMPSFSPVPRLTESWFCCAEPTAGQASALGLRIGRVPLTSV